ncbi:MAG: hypothetical protein ACI37Q_00395 [Candidatus Gastranaerophilaceae bacterium]
MVTQVKLFGNGIKTILKRQRGKRPALLQIFDSENCMIAQRECISRVRKDGSRELQKITLRQSKDSQGQIEYLSTIADKSGGWNSYRGVLPQYSDDIFINQHSNFPNLENLTEYHKEYIGRSGLFKYLDFPLLKASTQPMTKLEELNSTLDRMFRQWYLPKSCKLKEKVNPMMSSSIKKEFNIQ